MLCTSGIATVATYAYEYDATCIVAQNRNQALAKSRLARVEKVNANFGLYVEFIERIQNHQRDKTYNLKLGNTTSTDSVLYK